MNGMSSYEEVKQQILHSNTSSHSKSNPSSTTITMSIHKLTTHCTLRKVNRMTLNGNQKKVKKVNIIEAPQDSTVVILVTGGQPDVVLPVQFEHRDPLISWAVRTEQRTDSELSSIVKGMWDLHMSNSKFKSDSFEMAEYCAFSVYNGALTPLDLLFEKSTVRIRVSKQMKHLNLQLAQWCHGPRPAIVMHNQILECNTKKEQLNATCKRYTALSENEQSKLMELDFIKDFCRNCLDIENCSSSLWHSTMGIQHFILPKPNQLGVTGNPRQKGCLTLRHKREAHMSMAKLNDQPKVFDKTALIELFDNHKEFADN